LGNESARAYILKTDSVEHSAMCLGYTRGRIALHGPGRKPFAAEAAQTVEVYQFGEIEAVAESAARSENRVFKLYSGYLNSKQIFFCSLQLLLSHQTTSLPSKTGPSTQTRSYSVSEEPCERVSTTQP